MTISPSCWVSSDDEGVTSEPVGLPCARCGCWPDMHSLNLADLVRDGSHAFVCDACPCEGYVPPESLPGFVAQLSFMGRLSRIVAEDRLGTDPPI